MDHKDHYLSTSYNTGEGKQYGPRLDPQTLVNSIWCPQEILGIAHTQEGGQGHRRGGISADSVYSPHGPSQLVSGMLHILSYSHQYRYDVSISPFSDGILVMGNSRDNNLANGPNSIVFNGLTPAATATGLPAATVPPQTVETAIDPRVVTLVQERQDPNISPHRPKFLAHFPTFEQDPEGWFGMTLPYVATLTINITCLPDAAYLRTILESPQLPQLSAAIIKLELTAFHWFSGVAHNRKANPSLLLCAMMPNLAEITLHFHTAGMTTSAWSERDRIRLENEGALRRSKYLKVSRLSEVVNKYGLGSTFKCANLKKIHLVCYDSDMVRFHTQNGDPLSAFRDLKHWFIQGFIEVNQTCVDVSQIVESIDENGQELSTNWE